MQLNKIGVPVKHRLAVGDTWDDIWNALDEVSKHADIILITGSLYLAGEVLNLN